MIIPQTYLFNDPDGRYVCNNVDFDLATHRDLLATNDGYSPIQLLVAIRSATAIIEEYSTETFSEILSKIDKETLDRALVVTVINFMNPEAKVLMDFGAEIPKVLPISFDRIWRDSPNKKPGWNNLFDHGMSIDITLEYHGGTKYSIFTELECDVIIEFVKRGLDPNYINDENYTVFTKCRDLDEARELVRLGARPDLLFHAIADTLESPEVTRFLLENGASINMFDDKALVNLFKINYFFNADNLVESYKVLIEFGLNLNVVNESGMNATFYLDDDIVERLVPLGLRTDLINYDGETHEEYKASLKKSYLESD